MVFWWNVTFPRIPCNFHDMSTTIYAMYIQLWTRPTKKLPKKRQIYLKRHRKKSHVVSNVVQPRKKIYLKAMVLGKLQPGKFPPSKLPPGKLPPRKFPPGIFAPMFLNIPIRVFNFFVFSLLSPSSLILLKRLFSNSVLKELKSEIQKSMYQKKCSLPAQVW